MITIIRNYNITDIEDSINYLLDKASHSEEVRNLAIEITGNNSNSIIVIFDWVRNNVRYVPDPIDKELFTSPVRMVNDFRQGKELAEDCDGMAILTVALYRAIGIESNVLILDTGGKGYDHAVAQVYSEKINSWIIIDPSSDLPLGWEEKYFNRLVV